MPTRSPPHCPPGNLKVWNDLVACKLLRRWADTAGPSWVRALVYAGYGHARSRLQALQDRIEKALRDGKQVAKFEEPAMPAALYRLAIQLGPPFSLALMDEAWLAAWRAVKGDEPVPGGADTLAGPWQGGVRRMFALSERVVPTFTAGPTQAPCSV